MCRPRVWPGRVEIIRGPSDGCSRVIVEVLSGVAHTIDAMDSSRTRIRSSSSGTAIALAADTITTTAPLLGSDQITAASEIAEVRGGN